MGARVIPSHPAAEVLLFRFLGVAVIALAASARNLQAMRMERPGLHLLRAALAAAGSLALYLAGGVLDTGNKTKVVVNRRGPDGFIRPTVINVAAIEKGKQPDNFFLAPGDQIIVPGNRLKTVNRILALLPVANFFRVFTGGF